MSGRTRGVAMGKARLLSQLRAKAGVTKVPTPPPSEMSLAVVGARFDNPRRKGKPTGKRQSEILLCEPGDPVTLEHEPKNKHDRNAIAVYSSRGVQMGYIVADRTILIHKAWEVARDVRAIFQEPIVNGAAIRVAFDRDPVLPPPRVVDHVPEARKMVGGADAWDGVDYIPPDD